MIAMLGTFCGRIWANRTKIIALLLILVFVAPRPAQAQFGLDIGIIIAAINSINQAITNVIGGALRIMNQTLEAIQGFIAQIQNLFRNIVYPEAAINRARGLVGEVMGIYSQIRSIAQVAVQSATLANPRRLEQSLLSRNPLSISSVSGDYQTVYQPLPPATDAPPALRDVIDMSDAAAQAAMKRAIAIDALADQELIAAEQLMGELQVAAPGTAPMIEAQATAWLVRAHAYTQAALADSMRLRSIDLANAASELKFNATHGVTTRRQMGDMMRR
jgi:hypothetical protein